jgi:hypothetical protein
MDGKCDEINCREIYDSTHWRSDRYHGESSTTQCGMVPVRGILHGIRTKSSGGTPGHRNYYMCYDIPHHK